MSETVVPFPRRAAPPGAGTAAAEGAACPICGKPELPRYRPFCSKRCGQIDLGRWLGERYRVPGPETPDPESPAPESSDPDGEAEDAEERR